MPRHNRGGARPGRATLMAVAAFAALTLGSAQHAAAHNVLVDTTPGVDSIVEEQPGAVELVFDQYVQDEFTQVAVLDAAENPYQTGEPTVEGNVVAQAVEVLPDGDYTVSYRVISADGHPVSGTFDFSVAAGTAPAADQAANSGPAQDEDTEGGFGGTGVTTLIVAAVLAALALLTARSRQRLRRSTRNGDGIG